MVDVGSGVFQTQYRLNGEAGWRSDSRPFPLNQTGSQTVVYQSTDRALNTETPHTLTLPIDLAVPTLDGSRQSSAGQRPLVWHPDHRDRPSGGRGGYRIRTGQQRLATLHRPVAHCHRGAAQRAFSGDRSGGACGDERMVGAGHRHPAANDHGATQRITHGGGLVQCAGHGHVGEHRHPDRRLTNQISPEQRRLATLHATRGRQPTQHPNYWLITRWIRHSMSQLSTR